MVTWSTDQHVVNTLTNIPLLQVTISPPHHISLSLILPTTGLTGQHVGKNPQSYTITTGHHVTTSPYIPFSSTRHHLIICSANWHTLPQSERMNQLININEVMKKKFME